MGAVTVWYALEHALECFKYFMPISSDGWSLGRFAGMTNPDETAEYLANTIRNSAFSKNDFYIWACSGTNDVAYDRIWSQVQAMAHRCIFSQQSHFPRTRWCSTRVPFSG